MRNPYEQDTDDGKFEISRRAACALIAAFVLILLLPPLYRNVYEAGAGGDDAWIPVVEIFKKPADQSLLAHLKAFENDLEDGADFTGPPRQFVQGLLTTKLREGNRKTYIGRAGWLYLRPALDALTGYGPLAPEPDSVAKDPNREPWRAPLVAIKTFAGQLEELGVELMLVPIPVKPMIYPEHITDNHHHAPLQHRDAEEFYRQIEELPNASVLDLSRDFWRAKKRSQLFLRQDTHWTPEGMEIAASKIASILATRTRLPLTVGDPVEVSHTGDLVEQLNLPGGGLQFFQRESTLITPVSGFVSDPNAEVVLLGDSFTNIYSSATLNWGENAGLAPYLALKMGRSLDVIARNGQGSTGVRQELAARGKEHLRKKKTVIWAIAARDLFLSETAAREGNVTWEDVAIPDIPDTATKPGGASEKTESLQLTGTLIMKSAIKDPNSVTYKNAIFWCEYQVDEITAGEYEGETILVKDWAFRDKKLTSASRRKVGDKVSLNLVPFANRTKLQNEQEFNDIDFEVDVDKLLMLPYWSEPLPEAEGSLSGATTAGNGARASVIASAACFLAALLVIALTQRLARQPT